MVEDGIREDRQQGVVVIPGSPRVDTGPPGQFVEPIGKGGSGVWREPSLANCKIACESVKGRNVIGRVITHHPGGGGRTEIVGVGQNKAIHLYFIRRVYSVDRERDIFHAVRRPWRKYRISRRQAEGFAFPPV